jgi:hypothetical protein
MSDIAYMLLMLLLFPSGLFGFITDSTNVGMLALFGYIVYAVLIVFMYKLRKTPIAFLLLWLVVIALFIFNAVGCQRVSERVSSRVTLE